MVWRKNVLFCVFWKRRLKNTSQATFWGSSGGGGSWKSPYGKDSNLTWILGETFFFSGIWSSFLEYGSNDHKNFFLCLWEHKTLWNKKILNFWPFLWNLWPFAEKKSAIFRFLGEMGFFSKVHFSYIFWSFFEVMHCRMAKNDPKLMKICFSWL